MSCRALFRGLELLVFGCTLWLMCGPAGAAPNRDAIEISRAVVLASHPHDRGAFTQGLLYYNGYLFESTGLHGRSSVRRVDIDSGRVLALQPLPDRYFGEGLARVGNRLYQLTWKAGIAFVYRLPGLQRIGHFHYPGQGWGLTWNGRYLIMSDGSSVLRFIDPATFHVERRVQVTRSGKPVDNINELEYIRGDIWANVRFSDHIIRIDPESGRVTGVLRAGHLRQRLPASAGVMNGIAWDAQHQRLFITGKNWPVVFRIQWSEG